MKNLMTNKNLQVHLTKEEHLFISVVGTDGIEYKDNIDFYLNLLKIVQITPEVSNYQKLLRENGFDIDLDDLNDLLQLWLDLNILKLQEDCEKKLVDLNFEKYDRQIKNFGTLPGLTEQDGIEFQKKISASSIGVLGIGGVGSYIVQGLASMGIGKLKIVDGDIIELSNTSRQILYREHDIGKSKVLVAKEQVALISPKTEVEVLNTFIDYANIDEVSLFFEGIDFLILAADTPRGEIEYITDRLAVRNQVPWLTFAPFGFSKIFLGPLIIPNKTKTLKELIPQNNFIENSKLIKEINDNFYSTIMDPYNGMAAKMALIEVVKFITGYGNVSVINKRILIDTSTWEIEHYDLEN
ncbi:HesA/MoeB/ThiF family protein [Pseudolactococcus reticulitermitis]|uniref:THIF-type NAD/FAD binding fold domain-containing protein n=1 Tax=Pseudolactococcus reticulitermitis TaxID=2025039 RepID=A0A224XF12_9LACT|nr:ThiF family adenylyltransferase [Lactococcus reticulitermitis]GAX48215.1 hypothetical protein RsY01_1830 [Lactococcus reticulitermitis]